MPRKSKSSYVIVYKNAGAVQFDSEDEAAAAIEEGPNNVEAVIRGELVKFRTRTVIESVTETPRKPREKKAKAANGETKARISIKDEHGNPIVT